eukprot:TRINITY_DN17401_c0_g1_i1.p1 TRINITY_DN17401_c0_g1~~TRINITY_DN17401_c0_g1_i1.p1  ORF type:complete len:1119 (+),score=95.10 TRINITY_DN17401_c0_g1_i1:73-3429(+)
MDPSLLPDGVPDPADLRKPVLQESVKLRRPIGAAPPPMPPARHQGGFPTAVHRGEKRYARRGAPACTEPATSPRADTAQAEGFYPRSCEALPDGPAPDAVAAGAGFGEDGISMSAMEKGMANDSDGKMLAVAAVALRSRSAPVRTGCLARLLAIPPEDLRRHAAESDPIVAAQFLLAVRLALDSANPTHQADVLRVLDRLIDRANEVQWADLLDDTTPSAATTPLASWFDERTIFGLGVSSLDQPLNPVRNIPSASPWDPIQSVGELASVVKCDILEAVGRTQFAARLRWIYQNPRPEAPWMPDTVLRCLRHLTLSRIAGEAVAAAPQMIETLVEGVSAQAGAAPLASSKAALSRSTVCLAVLANLVKVSDDVADVVRGCGGVSKASAVIMTALLADTAPTDARSAHVRAALRLVRYGVLAGAATRHTVPSLFPALYVLMRARVPGAAWVLAAHGQVHGFREAVDGRQQVGLIDFVLRDATTLLAAAPSSHPPAAGRVSRMMHDAALFAVLQHALRAVPATAGMMDSMIAALRRVEAAVCGTTSPMARGAYALFEDEDQGRLTPDTLRPNATRWPGLTDAVAERVAFAAYHSAALALFMDAAGGALKMAAVESAAAQCLHCVLDHGEGMYNELREPRYRGLATCAVRHAGQPKQHSRMHAAILRSTVSLAVTAAAAYVDRKGSDAVVNDGWDWRMLCLNLSLYIQPCDASAFGTILRVLFEGHHPALYVYFTGSYESTGVAEAAKAPASKSVRFQDHEQTSASGEPRAKRGLMQRFAPGRLEPQIEWPFVVAVDADSSNGQRPAARMLKVTTAHGVTRQVLSDWGFWLGKVAAATSQLGLKPYLTHVHWREAVLRTSSVLCDSDGSTRAALQPYLELILSSRAEDAQALEEQKRDADVGHEPNPLVGPQAAWEKRLIEAPLQLAKRLLHAFESDGIGDELFTAVVLLLLEQGFPKAVRRAAAECLSVPQLAHLAGACFAGDTSPLFLGVAAYLGKPGTDFDEAPNPNEDARTAAGVLCRGVNPQNVLHIRAVHQLADYLFDDPCEGSLAFLAEETFALLPPVALRSVTLYSAPADAVALDGYMHAAVRDPASDPAAAARVASVKTLSLQAFKEAFPDA